MTAANEDTQTPNPQTAQRGKPAPAAWYAGQYKDLQFYLLIAVLLIELVVGSIAFFYGLIHAAPETPGGPPLARFPWVAWAAAAMLAPVGLLLVVHLTGRWVSHVVNRDEAAVDKDEIPERLQRFYAIIRNAPTVVVLVGILLLGTGIIFVDGALSALTQLGGKLVEYTPWIAGSIAAFLAVCYVAHRWFVFSQRRMEQEYAYRHEVLQRTGIVLVDQGCVPLAQSPQNSDDTPRIAQAGTMKALPQVLDVVAEPESEAGSQAAVSQRHVSHCVHAGSSHSGPPLATKQGKM